MAAPNIANLTTITGVSTFVAGISTTAYTVILSNAASSNQVLKLNTLMASNTGNSTVNVSVKIFNQASGAGSSVSIASSIIIPFGSTLTLVAKDTPIYIEENRSIGAIGISTSTVDIVASYEIIS